MKLSIGLGLALCLGASGCSRFFSTGPALNAAFPRAPESLDPVIASSPVALATLDHLHDSLVQMEGGKPAPSLAQAWTVDKTGTRYAFLLADRKWSDGVAIRAQDFVFAWRRHLQSGSRSVALPTLMKVRGAKAFHAGKPGAEIGIKAISSRELEIVLTRRDPGFLAALANPVLAPQREDVFKAHPKSFTDPLHLRASGPYQLLDASEGRQMVLVANSYAPAPPAATKVRIAFLSNSGEASRRLEQGSLDVIHQSPGNFRYGSRLAELPVLPTGFPDFSQVKWK